MTETRKDPIAETIVALLHQRGDGNTICPGEVARELQEAYGKPKDPPQAWRRYMKPVRQMAIHMARRGEIEILRKGVVQDPHAPVKGLIRLARPGTGRPAEPAGPPDID